ncbi:MAG: substrate-binding domain-containing protein [Kiritimatiellia bacterium]
MPASKKIIGVFARPDSSVKRSVVSAIARAAPRFPAWEWVLVAPPAVVREFRVPDQLNGLLAWPDDEQDAQTLCAAKLPTVFIGQIGPPGEARVDRVMFDNHHSGRQIADFFLGKGFNSFAGFRDRSAAGYSYAIRRWQGFVDGLAESGLPEPPSFDGYPGSLNTEGWLKQLPALGRWLQNLPEGTAVFCERDRGARDLSTACAHFGIGIPDSLALLGVGNDDLLCGFGTPSLSSLDLDGDRAGTLAVELLAHRLRFPRAKPQTETLRNFRIVERASTNRIAVEDEVIRDALQTIRAHMIDGIDVESLSLKLGRGRRSLEKHFQAVLGHGPHREILLARIEFAKAQLVETNKPIADIAELCGFSEPQRLSEVFAREVGVSPRAWRKQYGK